jgi:hypothetical protein
MSYLYQPLNEEEQQQGAQQQAPNTGAIGLSAAPAVAPASSNPATASMTPAPAQNGSGRFVNFDRLLALNSGTASALGQSLASDAETEATNADRAVDNSSNDFRNAAISSAERTIAEPNRIARIMGVRGVRPDQEEIVAAAQYGGPTDYDAFMGDRLQGLYATVDNAQRHVSALNDANGRQGLIEQLYAKSPSYSSDMARWDSALTGGAAGGRFSDLANRYSNLHGLVDNARSKAGDALSQAQGLIDNTNRIEHNDVDMFNETHQNGFDNYQSTIAPGLEHVGDANERVDSPKPTSPRPNEDDEGHIRNRGGPGIRIGKKIW